MIRSAAGAPRLETERLVVRMPAPADAGALSEFAASNREHFARWDPLRDDAYFTVAGCRARLEIMRDEAAAGRMLPFVLLPKHDEKRIIGQCSFTGIVGHAFHAAYLGYGLDHRWVGQGLMHEALRAAIDYGFGVLNLHRIMANHLPGNSRSANVLRRLGFVHEGYARNYLRIAGRWEDHVMTSLTNPDWKPPSAI